MTNRQIAREAAKARCKTSGVATSVAVRVFHKDTKAKRDAKNKSKPEGLCVLSPLCGLVRNVSSSPDFHAFFNVG